MKISTDGVLEKGSTPISLKNIRYDSIKPGTFTVSNIGITTPKFGFATPIQMENFSINSPTSNSYLNGFFQITIRNKNDIDIILKYSSSEIGIGFYDIPTSSVNIKYIWIITKVIEYYITSSEEYLVLQINVPPIETINYTTYTPYLFVNNMIPLNSAKTETTYFTLADGNCFRSSCTTDITKYNKTYYDKIFYYKNDIPDYTPIISNVIGNVSSSDPRTDNPYFELETGVSLIINHVSIKEQPACVNNLFLSFLYSHKPITFKYNSYGTSINFNKNYITYNEGTSIGGVLMKIDTIPFYSGTSDYYSLDRSYKNEVLYSNIGINNPLSDPGGSLHLQKTIFNINPGNMLNNMSYYNYISKDGVNRLIYSSSNFSSQSNIFNTSPVLNLESGSSYQENSFMTPYDKKLYILGSTCN